ncbi:helix-turn-helix domain-containing protein [Paraburkholderia caribensis]|uniref:helix-turn-helix domain-containing protein n=1 Tax=Paraburkholderia caribensis TaxID=75105 RepID=UPI0009EDF3DC|nr:helix-turn-helix domain-containing protein [Paraburkholderia caribensis]
MGRSVSRAQSEPGVAVWDSDLRRRYGLAAAPLDPIGYALDIEPLTDNPIKIFRAHLEAVALSTTHSTADIQKCLLVVLVSSGSIQLEQNGKRASFAADDLFVLDVSRSLNVEIARRTILTAIALPKAELRKRGFRSDLDTWAKPDRYSARTQLIRCILEAIADHVGMLGEDVRVRMLRQLLDIMDLVIGEDECESTLRALESTHFRVKRYIGQHLGDDRLCASMIANGLNLPVHYLNRLFRSENTSLMRYVWSERLELSHRMLSSTEHHSLRIGEIAWRCGFTSSAHFSRLFRQRFGVSPSTLRRTPTAIDTRTL